MNDTQQSKNEYILFRAWYNNELHHAIMLKDVKKVEVMLNQFTKDHLSNCDFSLYDSNTVIDIDYIKAEHMREILEEYNNEVHL